jgi:hypothetical protein
MKDHRVGRAPHRCPTTPLLLTGACLVLLAGGWRSVVSAPPDYIQEDARISGKEIHAFTEGAEQGMVVLGDFRLTMGKHVISGRDAVVWTRQTKVANAVRRDMVVYVEGEAKVVEPGGATTMDRTMLVTLRQQGQLTAAGKMSDQPLKDFPLYRNALAAREAAARGAAARVESTTQTTTGAAAEPPGAGGVKIAVTPSPAKPKPVQPLTFEAKDTTSEIRGSRRITVVRDVHLWVGNPDSLNFLEMSAQSAVAFSERRPAKEATVPWSPKLGGIASDLPGPKDQKETLVGIYLEGDVVIGRGERSLRGPAAYYDFPTDRAVIVDPVFRTIQEQRNIPIYVRADEARALSAREMFFQNARISTSDFYTPSYSIGARTARLMDNTPYDEQGVRLGPQNWKAELNDVTYNIGATPILYWPHSEADFEQEHTPLRKVAVGSHGRFGFGVETEWHLFRLLGLLPPKGFDARLELDWYRRGPMAGITTKYTRDTYSGYGMIYGLVDREKEDSFGDEREDIPAPGQRGRLLARHKQIMPEDWELQFELSYLCDKNYLEQFFPDEYYAGKEQETLIYAKKQKDNWAFTALLQYRLNRFDTQTESAPDLGFYLIGQPLLGGNVDLYSESHAGIKRFRPANDSNQETSDWFARADTRTEIDAPLKLGPVTVTPYAVGRATYWGDTPDQSDQGRLYGQAGVKASMSTWRVYKDATSRLWDLNGLKHVVTPEAVAFVSGAGNVKPSDVYPMDADIEQNLRDLNGYAIGVSQRLVTKRGPEGDQHQVDWMRLKVMGGFFDPQLDSPHSDGRLFWYRPENSLARHCINGEYTWNISDSTEFLADLNYDIDSRNVARTDLGLVITRDPRLRYYLGWRRIQELHSSVGTVGVEYQLNRVYTVGLFEQYDFDFDGGRNLATGFSIIRKLERWYAGVTFVFDQRQGSSNFGLYLTLWPEGIPEFRLGSGRMSISNSSSMN